MLPDGGEKWRGFVADRCGYPAPGRLRAQLAAAEFHSPCACGCNSFDVRLRATADLPPLVSPGGGGAFFDAEFELASGDLLSVILFADGNGDLASVEIILNNNGAPVPDQIGVVGAPFFVHASRALLAD